MTATTATTVINADDDPRRVRAERSLCPGRPATHPEKLATAREPYDLPARARARRCRTLTRSPIFREAEGLERGR